MDKPKEANSQTETVKNTHTHGMSVSVVMCQLRKCEDLVQIPSALRKGWHGGVCKRGQTARLASGLVKDLPSKVR